MRAAVAACLLAAGWISQVPAQCGPSYLYQPAYAIDHYLRFPVEPYRPQPGDLFFAVTEDFVMRWGHQLAGAAAPHHCGIVFARPDGRLAVLEAGPFNSLIVSGWDVFDHLRAYHASERCWIRRRKTPLTRQESEALTAFCIRQVGKDFAVGRVVGQLTPFRSRGPIRTEYACGPRGDRAAWFCAELLTEALAASGLIDAATARPAATYPRDLFCDSSPDWWLNRHLNLSCGWHPPARWTDNPAAPPRREYRSW
jgi:hypothetical protein